MSVKFKPWAHFADDVERAVDVGVHPLLAEKLNKRLPILADKAYPGLKEFNAVCPDKSHFKEKRCQVENLAKKRVKIEHFFARLKVFKILQNAHIHVAKKAHMAQ